MQSDGSSSCAINTLLPSANLDDLPKPDRMALGKRAYVDEVDDDSDHGSMPGMMADDDDMPGLKSSDEDVEWKDPWMDVDDEALPPLEDDSAESDASSSTTQPVGAAAAGTSHGAHTSQSAEAPNTWGKTLPKGTLHRHHRSSYVMV